MEDDKQSSEAVEGTKMESTNQEEDKIEQQKVNSSNDSSDCTVDNLPSVQLPAAGDLHSDFDASAHLLSEVPVVYSLQPIQQDESNDHAKVSERPLKFIAAQSSQASPQNKVQLADDPSNLEHSATSVTQSISSISDPAPPQKKLSLMEEGSKQLLTQQDKQNAPELKPLSPVPVQKTPDGYNWRKYGQKQVKSPEGSRSYFRCTFSECSAKKIECCDRLNRVIETVYRGHHNHDRPQKLTPTRERPALSAVPANGNNKTVNPVGVLSPSIQPTAPKAPLVEMAQIPQNKQQDTSDSDETIEANAEEEHVDIPELKKRPRKSTADDSDSLSKLAKKPKYVVHAAGDVGISADGYRWRKYGQKMVKGNPHPRNYYRCTSAGCPVRKHIERAVDNNTTVMITYKGVHDHDMPVPKKRQGSMGNLLAAATPASMNNLPINKTEPCRSQTSATQWSVEKKGELSGEAMDLSMEKKVEPPRTLLSIGFEIKPC